MATDLEEIRAAGDVILSRAEVVNTSGFGQDISNQISGIQVYESLFDPFITGVLIVDDTLDLINLFPLVGEEFLNLSIRTPTLERLDDGTSRTITGKFYIYKISEREYIGDKRLSYKLHFISFEALVDLNKKLSLPFNGKCSDIAKNIVTSERGLESKKRVYVEESANSIKFVSNFWSPVKCLNYVSERAVNYKDSPTYYFYENRNGFNFGSLQNLAVQNPVQTFTYDAYSRDFNSNGQSIKNVEEEYKRVRDISVPVVYDYMDRIRSGTYTSKLITHDLATKQYNVRTFSMLNSFDKETTLNQNPISSSKNIAFPDAALMTKPLCNFNFTGYGDVTTSDKALKRVSRINQFRSNAIEIVVPGRTDYTVGQRVTVIFYKNTPLAAGEDIRDHIDKIYTGTYLISAINHYVSRKEHECNLELIKDSYIVDLDEGGLI